MFHLFGKTRDPLPPKVVSSKEARGLIVTGRAPRGMRVQGRLDLKGCDEFTHLPDDLSADIVDVRGCERLGSLPAGLRADSRGRSGMPCLG